MGGRACDSDRPLRAAGGAAAQDHSCKPSPSSSSEVLSAGGAAKIRQLQALTELDLSFCEKLAALPPEIGQLQALTKINLFRCLQLAALPPEIRQLQASPSSTSGSAGS